MSEKKKTAYERKQTRNRRIVQIVAILLAALMIGGVLLSAVPVFAITKSEVDALKNKVAAATAKKNDLKKQVSSILSEGIVQTEVFSFTKNKSYMLTLKAEFIKPDDNVLLIDDFLANGEAAFGGIRLIEQTGAKVAGVGTVIAKAFQPGMEKLRAAGYRVEALAPVKAMGAGYIEFE